MTVTIGINDHPIEVVGIVNRGPVKGEPGIYGYHWESTNGARGMVTHRRDAGAASLAATVMLDRITRKPGDDDWFSIETIEQLNHDEVHVEIEGEVTNSD